MYLALSASGLGPVNCANGSRGKLQTFIQLATHFKCTSFSLFKWQFIKMKNIQNIHYT